MTDVICPDSSSTILIDKKTSWMIRVAPNEVAEGYEYFNLFDDYPEIRATRIASISFFGPRYESKSNNHRKNSWTLDENERRTLIEILQRKSNMIDSEGNILTNWEKCIVQFNLERGLFQDKTEENTMDNLKYPQYLPIDLPMPDYTKLA